MWVLQAAFTWTRHTNIHKLVGNSTISIGCRQWGASDTSIPLHRMAFAHKSIFECSFGVSSTCSSCRWPHYNGKQYGRADARSLQVSDVVVEIKANAYDADISSNRFLGYLSDGGGRSGVYLAIDANMELAEEEDCFHVFGYLKKLRQSRKGLIENVVSV